MDAVYILGTGSRWANNELRYSLRGLKKHATGLGTIWIVGEKPDWIVWGNGIEHIPHSEPNGYNRANIWHKVRTACLDERISTDFLYMDDDFFFVEDCDITNFPYYHKGYINYDYFLNCPDSPEYQQIQMNTRYALMKVKEHIKHFDLHVPIVFNKEKLLHIYNTYGPDTHDNLMLFRTAYGNHYRIEGEYLRDLKFGRRLTIDVLKSAIRDRYVFSIGDDALNDDLGMFMSRLYPEKSVYEK
jgi:hypothetical protein